MIGGLALAGTTAAITDHPNSPRSLPAPTSGSGRHRSVASGVQSGSSAAGTDGQEPLELQEANGWDETSMNLEGQDLISASAGAADDGHAVKASQSGHGGTGRNLNESDQRQQGTGHPFQNTFAHTLAGSLPSLSQGDTKGNTAAAAASTAARSGSNLTPMSTAIASGSTHMHSDSMYGDSINSMSGTPSVGADLPGLCAWQALLGILLGQAALQHIGLQVRLQLLGLVGTALRLSLGLKLQDKIQDSPLAGDWVGLGLGWGLQVGWVSQEDLRTVERQWVIYHHIQVRYS